MSTETLLKERASLLARLEEIEKALELAGKPLKAHRIYTRRNLRNSYLASVEVYADEKLTIPQDVFAHEGYISGEAAATLTSAGEVDGDLIQIESL